MVNLYENYNVNDDAGLSLYDVNWHAQVFTPITPRHWIKSVRVKMYVVGSVAGLTLTASLRRTNDVGVPTTPTGADFASGTLNATLFSGSPGNWNEIPLTPWVDSQAFGAYLGAVILRLNGGDVNNKLVWRDDDTAGYANGNAAYSNNSGVDWFTSNANDLMFENYGDNFNLATLIRFH